MAAHLSYGRVNLNVLREAVRRELREFLDKCAGSKVRDGGGDSALEPGPAWPHPVRPPELQASEVPGARGPGGAGRGALWWDLRQTARSLRGGALSCDS